MREVGAFGEPDQWRFDWERTYTTDRWVDQVPTTGDHSQFPPAQLLAGIGGTVDAVGGTFTMRYVTIVATATRVHAPAALER